MKAFFVVITFVNLAAVYSINEARLPYNLHLQPHYPMPVVSKDFKGMICPAKCNYRTGKSCLFAHPLSDKRYYSCVNGKAMLHVCALGKTFSDEKSSCVDKSALEQHLSSSQMTKLLEKMILLEQLIDSFETKMDKLQKIIVKSDNKIGLLGKFLLKALESNADWQCKTGQELNANLQPPTPPLSGNTLKPVHNEIGAIGIAAQGDSSLTDLSVSTVPTNINPAPAIAPANINTAPAKVPTKINTAPAKVPPQSPILSAPVSIDKADSEKNTDNLDIDEEEGFTLIKEDEEEEAAKANTFLNNEFDEDDDEEVLLVNDDEGVPLVSESKQSAVQSEFVEGSPTVVVDDSITVPTVIDVSSTISQP